MRGGEKSRRPNESGCSGSQRATVPTAAVGTATVEAPAAAAAAAAAAVGKEGDDYYGATNRWVIAPLNSGR